MPTVHDLLASKGNEVHSISGNVTVLEATKKMNRNKIGALLVMEGRRLAGIFTERDVLTRVVGCMRSPETMTVAEAMTGNVVCCRGDDDINEVAALMTNERIRHVPVCDDEGELLGMISIGDVNAHYARAQQSEIQYLNEFIYGRA